ncbi:unnamed protein product, partial [Litomosoides sigmodontis]
MNWSVQQIKLYTICIPVIFALCILAVFCNLLVLLARIQIRNRSGALELTFSLALSDIWTSIVIVVSLFRNSYMPVVLGVNYSSVCFPLTLEAFRTGGLLTGLLHLSTLAVYHLLSTTRPFDHDRLLNKRKTRLIVILIWLLPPATLLLYFSAWPNQGYRVDNCSIFAKSTTTIRKRRVVIASGLIFGTFVIGWLPASLLYILTAQDMPLYHVKSIWLNIFALTTLTLIMIKSITNPIIYATR